MSLEGKVLTLSNALGTEAEFRDNPALIVGPVNSVYASNGIINSFDDTPVLEGLEVNNILVTNELENSGFINILDVNGLRIANNAGLANQVLSKNGVNELEWLTPSSADYKSSIKTIVDPTSNTGPFNGLLIPAQPDFSFQMPLRLTSVPALKLANAFEDDPNNDYTINSNFIRINNIGTYMVTFNTVILSNNANERKSVWVLENGDIIFVNAPIVGVNIRQPGTITNPFYSQGYSLEGSSIINVQTTPKDICLTLFLNNNTSANELIRSCFLSINKIN